MLVATRSGSTTNNNNKNLRTKLTYTAGLEMPDISKYKNTNSECINVTSGDISQLGAHTTFELTFLLHYRHYTALWPHE